jgi:phosphocarrier protein
MIERELTVVNRNGIHARPAALIVQTSGKFVSEIFFEKDGQRINANSIMGVMLLAAACQTRVRLLVSGTDEEAAAGAIAELFEKGFHELEE